MVLNSGSETEIRPLDGARIDFLIDASNEINEFDATKSGNPAENIAFKNNNILLSMESRTLPENNEQLPLYVGNYKSSNYQLNLQIRNFVETQAYLMDNYLNTITQIVPNEETIYPYSISAEEIGSDNDDRFKIVFVNIPLSNEIVEKTSFSVYPNPTSDRLFINVNATFESANVQLFNTVGQKVFENNLLFNANNQIELNNLDLQNGLYILKLKTNSGEVFESKIIVE
ncbi:MAG: T9SS type A sorting domain-containing protein [Flavobacterium sp.]